MGQGWSEERFLNPAPRQRLESDPPASTSGGHTVSTIPENEEVNAQTTDIQFADWKKASGASGILEEKSQYHPAPSSATASSGGSECPQGPGVNAPVPKITRAKSLDYQHLADFSMFPDKFSDLSFKAKAPTDKKQSGKTRTMSTSEPAKDVSNNEQKKASLSVPDSQPRQRSASFGGRLPFFDFSMIPDKDPNYQEIVRKKPETKNDRTSGIVVTQDAASLVAAALTMAANSESPAATAKRPPMRQPPKSTRPN